MEAATLVKAMPGLSATRAAQLIRGCNDALLVGGMTTVNRVAMFLAQVGEESGSLQWTEELADGSEYNGRADLGNTYPGDGPRFKGRSFIQITGRTNYLSFSGWAHARGLVAQADYFVQHPEQLANDEFAWMGPVWYFTVARSNLNQLADAGDIVAATREINGGLNGLADRQARWANCLRLGNALLPARVTTTDWFDMATKAELDAVVLGRVQQARTTLQHDLTISVARGGSLYVSFPKAKVPSAVYRVDGNQLLWMSGADFSALAHRYGGLPYVVQMDTTSAFFKLPIVPGTPDLRK